MSGCRQEPLGIWHKDEGEAPRHRCCQHHVKQRCQGAYELRKQERERHWVEGRGVPYKVGGGELAELMARERKGER
ncbi:hypothetical protein E2C01_083752 [Portunus trituberculatus]|uniref:Uncharacterized protein n=1 Tax=Portunus trituberculatus TaxID=210409 RepID=A0A5B7ITA0_PORTR|nr:hypothetical protein [Portunus trituberculatus]